ncbi:MAG: KH domain-containing protein [Candidatus Woykebacteria bacterium]
MKDLLEFIVKGISEDSSKVSISEQKEEGLDSYTIFVAEKEIGKIIGKGGKVIKAIRTLVKLKAIKDGSRVRLNSVEAAT